MEMNVKRKLNESQFYICLYGREGDRWGENESPIWGLGQKVFPFPPIHLNGCPRNPIYHLLAQNDAKNERMMSNFNPFGHFDRFL